MSEPTTTEDDEFGAGYGEGPEAAAQLWPKSEDRPQSDAAWWLYEYQKLTRDVLWWVANGKSETATQAMLAMGRRWSEAPDANS